MCLWVYATCVWVPTEIRRVSDPLKLELQVDGCELPNIRCWEPNSGFLEDQKTLFSFVIPSAPIILAFWDSSNSDFLVIVPIYTLANTELRVLITTSSPQHLLSFVS